jgi:hypothetical protein
MASPLERNLEPEDLAEAISLVPEYHNYIPDKYKEDIQRTLGIPNTEFTMQ